MSRMWGFPRLASTKTILKTAMKTSRRGALRCGLEKVKSMDSDQLEQVAAGVVGPIPQQHLVSTKCDNVFGEDGRFFFGWNDWSPSLGLKAGPMGYQHLLCEGMGLGVQQPSRESAESHHEARVHLPQWKDCEWLISSLEAWNEETHFSVGCASKFLKTQSSIRWYPGSSENLPSRFRNSAVSKRIQVFAPQKTWSYSQDRQYLSVGLSLSENARTHFLHYWTWFCPGGQERGITILAKNAAVSYKGIKVRSNTIHQAFLAGNQQGEATWSDFCRWFDFVMLKHNIYIHTYMIWLWKTDDLRLVQRRFFPFMVLNFKATEVYLPSRFWGIVAMFEFSHAADSFWLQHSVWTASATLPPVLPWVALLPVPCWLVFWARLGASWSGICVFFWYIPCGDGNRMATESSQFCLEKNTIQMHSHRKWGMLFDTHNPNIG